MIIRKWNFTDILSISEIEKKSFSAPWSFKILADTFLFNKFTGVLSETDGKITGYGGFTNVQGEADITKIAVSEEYRRQGVGNKILKEMLRLSEEAGVSVITLEVRTSNEAAINLYKNNGFTVTATRKNYYGNEDAFVMQYKFE